MSLHNALQHSGGLYPKDMLATLRELAIRDGLPHTADLEDLAKRAGGVRPHRFSSNGSVFSDGTHYFCDKWCLEGSDEDGEYATDVRFRKGE